MCPSQMSNDRQFFCALKNLDLALAAPTAGGRPEEELEVRHLFTHLCRHKEQTNLGVFITEI